MALFLDANGQLVVATSMPVGGSIVSNAATTNLVDTAPFFRALDDGTNAWHPANYYASNGETPNLITGQLSLQACTLASDTAGVVSNFATATGTFKVWNGTTDVTTQCAFATTTLTTLTASIDATGVYSATAIPTANDTGSATFSATYKGQTLSLTFLVSKIKNGTVGYATGTLDPLTQSASIPVDVNSYYSTNANVTIKGLYQKISNVWQKVSAATSRKYKMASSPAIAVTPVFGDEWANTGATQTVLGVSIPAGSTSVWNGTAWEVITSVSLSGVGAPSGTLGKPTDTYFHTTNSVYYEKTNSTQWDVRANYLTSFTALTDGATLSNAVNLANANNAAITDMASDSILSAVEKLAVRTQWDAIEKDYLKLSTAASSTELTAFISAVQALGTYLNGGTYFSGFGSIKPYWINDVYISASFAIVPTTFRSYFENVYSAKIALLKKLSDDAALTATWTNITARPLNLAQFDATAGAKLNLQAVRAYLKQAVSATQPSKPVGNITGAYSGLGIWYTGTQTAPISGEAQWQCDGIFDPSTNTTVWNELPYQSYLKVDTLAALTVNTGNLNIDNALTLNTNAVLKSYGNAGFETSGIYLDYNNGQPRFSVGNTTNGMSWNSASATLNIYGSVIATGNIKAGAIDSTKLATTVTTSIANAATTATWAGVSGVAVSTAQIQNNAVTAVDTISSSSITLANAGSVASASTTTTLLSSIPCTPCDVITVRPCLISLDLTHYDSSPGYIQLQTPAGTIITDVMSRLTSGSNVSEYSFLTYVTVPANTSTIGGISIVLQNDNTSNFWNAGQSPYASVKVLIFTGKR